MHYDEKKKVITKRREISIWGLMVAGMVLSASACISFGFAMLFWHLALFHASTLGLALLKFFYIMMMSIFIFIPIIPLGHFLLTPKNDPVWDELKQSFYYRIGRKK